MATEGFDERWREIREIWQGNQWLFALAGFLIGVLFFPFLQMLVENIGETLKSFVPEAAGITFTVLVIGHFNEKRAKRFLKEQLIREMGHPSDNGIAIKAARELRDRNWLQDGSVWNKNLEKANLSGAELRETSLKGINLEGANLQNTVLSRADLQNAKLSTANMQRTHLHATNLENASLNAADLRSADLGYSNLSHAQMLVTDLRLAILQGANMQNANLRFAKFQRNGMHEVNLENADLSNANLIESAMNKASLRGTVFRQAKLQHVWLNDANLRGALFQFTQIDAETILPDGTHYTPELGLEQLERFTNPDHPEFWQPEWVKG